MTRPGTIVRRQLQRGPRSAPAGARRERAARCLRARAGGRAHGCTLVQLVDTHLAAQRALAIVEATERQDSADRLPVPRRSRPTRVRSAATPRSSSRRMPIASALPLLNDLTSAYLAVADRHDVDASAATKRCARSSVCSAPLTPGSSSAAPTTWTPRSTARSSSPRSPAAPAVSSRSPSPGAAGTTPSEPCCNSSPCSSTDRSSTPGCWSSRSGSNASAPLLGEELEPEAIIDRLLDDGLDQTTASFGAILLLEGGKLRLAGASVTGHQAMRGPIDARSGVAVRRRSLVLASRCSSPTTSSIKRYVEEHGLGRARGVDPGVGHRPAPGTGPAVRSRRDAVRGRRSRSIRPSGRSSSRSATVWRRHSSVEARSAQSATARREAELATERVSGMRELAADLSRATTRRGVAGALLRYATRLTGAASGLVAVHDRRTDDAELLAAVGPGVGGRQAPDMPADLRRAPSPTRRCTRATIDDAGLPGPIVTHLRSDQAGAVATYPLTAGSRQVGGVLLGWSEPAVPSFDRDELRAALSMTGPALRRAGRYDIDHEIAVTLQRSQLTVPAVEIPGISWSARYRSGSPGVAGGDWYDVIALERGGSPSVIGDIVGKGVQAAAAMGQLRSATRALAHRVDDAGQLLEALDDYVRATGQGLFSSLAVVVIDAAAGTARAGGRRPSTSAAVHPGQAGVADRDRARTAARRRRGTVDGDHPGRRRRPPRALHRRAHRAARPLAERRARAARRPPSRRGSWSRRSSAVP